MRVIVCAALAAAACSKSAADKPGPCLPLPAAVRHELTADPGGTALYWLESAVRADYDANRKLYSRLIRYDLRTRRTDVVLDHVAAPIQFVDGRLLALLVGDGYRLVLVDPDGRSQELTPENLDVIDVEVVDPNTLAVLADGSGKRAVYTLDLRQPRVQHLIDADVLVGTSAGRVFVRDDDDGIAIDPKTGTRGTFAVHDKGRANGDGEVFVDQQRVFVQSMTSGDVKTLIATPRDWKLVHQPAAVLARTAPAGDRSYAWRIAAGSATPLPTLVGGTSILSIATIGKQTWALVGHNTANFVGDLAETTVESDVCKLPASGEMSIPTRSVPARYVGAGDRLVRLLSDATRGGSAQILEGDGDPTTVYIVMEHPFGARDLDGMRTQTRALAKLVRSQLAEREIRVQVIFGDRRTGVVRWTRERLREHTLVGMGDALLTDPGEFDLEIGDLVDTKQDGTIRCSGTVKNLRAQPADVDLKCSGNRDHVIHVAALEPNERRPFAQTFEVSKLGEAAYLEAFIAGTQVDWRDLAREDQAQAVFALATDVYASTRLALISHDIDNDPDRGITLELHADGELLKRSHDEQTAAITRAYEKYEALRGIYHVDAKAPMQLHVKVELSSVEFSYDGSRLTRDE